MAGRPKKVVEKTLAESVEESKEAMKIASCTPGEEVKPKIAGYKSMTAADLATTTDPALIDLRKALDELGIVYEPTDSVLALAKKLSKEATQLHKSKVDSSVDVTQARLNSYPLGSNLTDKDFIKRLYFLGVSNFYLKPMRDPRDPNKAPTYLFYDIDAKLSDKQIHERIRFCGFVPQNMQTVINGLTQPRSRKDSMAGHPIQVSTIRG